MIIWVDDLIFAHGARDVDRLALLRNAATRRHTLIVSNDPADAHPSRSSPAFDLWHEGLSDRLRREVGLLRSRLALVSGNAVARGATRLLVSERTARPVAAGCWVTTEEAVRAVGLPTCVLVENAINDRQFLRRAMPPLWRERLDVWERGGLMRYENGGGNSVMAQLVEFFAEDENARKAFGLPAALWRLVHVLVYDHDGTTAQEPGEGARRLDNACRRAGLDHVHMLHRRDQEHYLPVEAMRAIVQLHVTNPADRERLLVEIDALAKGGSARQFADLPRLGRNPYFKNRFGEAIPWSDEWFQRDEAWPEMTLLAEKIAAAI